MSKDPTPEESWRAAALKAEAQLADARRELARLRVSISALLQGAEVSERARRELDAWLQMKKAE